MRKAYIEYCSDGYNLIRIDIICFCELDSILRNIQEQTGSLFSCPFTVDIVLQDIGRISVGLADPTILCYCSADLNTQLSSVGNLSAEGTVSFYFGDYSVISSKHLIPYPLALKELEHFIDTKELSSSICWTQKLL